MGFDKQRTTKTPLDIPRFKILYLFNTDYYRARKYMGTVSESPGNSLSKVNPRAPGLEYLVNEGTVALSCGIF